MRTSFTVGLAGTVCAVLMVATMSGCTGGPPEGPAEPGVESGAFGGIEVVGYLTEMDGVLAVLDAEISASSAQQPRTLATLVSGSVDEAGISVLAGRYIWAAGRTSDSDAEVPEIKVDGIEVAEEPQSEE